jgi:SEC-C motif
VLKWIRRLLAGRPRVDYRNAGRNDDCPCGSGRKFKHCCIDHVEKKARSDRDSSLFGSSKG